MVHNLVYSFRKMQIKTAMPCHYMPIRLSEITNNDNTRCWQGHGENESIIYLGIGSAGCQGPIVYGQTIEPVWKRVWQPWDCFLFQSCLHFSLIYCTSQILFLSIPSISRFWTFPITSTITRPCCATKWHQLGSLFSIVSLFEH